MIRPLAVNLLSLYLITSRRPFPKLGALANKARLLAVKGGFSVSVLVNRGEDINSLTNITR